MIGSVAEISFIILFFPFVLKMGSTCTVLKVIGYVLMKTDNLRITNVCAYHLLQNVMFIPKCCTVAIN